MADDLIDTIERLKIDTHDIRYWGGTHDERIRMLERNKTIDLVLDIIARKKDRQ